jgi:hypothetical protein
MLDFRAPDALQPVADPDRLDQRLRVLAARAPKAGAAARTPAARDWDELHGRAVELARGSGIRQAFQMHREPGAVRERYGMHPLGQNLLLVRRLVEAGVGFVTVNGWTFPPGPPRWRWAARFKLGYAWQRDGHGQRLRQRPLRPRLVLPLPRPGPVRSAD